MQRLAAALLAAILVLAPIEASDHKTIAHDKLEVGKTYHVDLGELILYTQGPFQLNEERFYRGVHILKIRARLRDRRDGKLWYDVNRIKPATLDRSQHSYGLVRASDLAKGTVFVPYE